MYLAMLAHTLSIRSLSCNMLFIMAELSTAIRRLLSEMLDILITIIPSNNDYSQLTSNSAAPLKLRSNNEFTGTRATQTVTAVCAILSSARRQFWTPIDAKMAAMRKFYSNVRNPTE